MTQTSLTIIQEITDAGKAIGLIGLPGILGAASSVLLVIFKILEHRRERLQLFISRSLSHPDHGGNEIIIQNPSKTPALISHWELLWRKRRLFKQETTQTLDYGFPEDRRDLTIAAYGTHTLHFTEENYFEWGYAKTRHKGVLYLELHIVGRKAPLLLEVYNPNR